MILAFSSLGTGTLAAVGLLNRSDDEEPVLVFDPQVGELDETTLKTLIAFVHTYIGLYGGTAHYESYFRWRSENLPEYRSTYQAFALVLDEAALSRNGTSYIEADPTIQQEIQTYTLHLPQLESSLTNPVISNENSEALTPAEQQLWLRFHTMVLGEIIHVFLNTNAWVMLGYENWPGQPRGLENYVRPV